jgi:hypothetical protein
MIPPLGAIYEKRRVASSSWTEAKVIDHHGSGRM